MQITERLLYVLNKNKNIVQILSILCNKEPFAKQT